MGDNLIERVHQPAFIKKGNPKPPKPPPMPKVTRIKTPATRKK
jgi:hypothetical protein